MMVGKEGRKIWKLQKAIKLQVYLSVIWLHCLLIICVLVSVDDLFGDAGDITSESEDEDKPREEQEEEGGEEREAVSV